MAEVVHRALWARPAPPEETLVVSRGARKWRLCPDELAEILDELRARGISYGAGPGLLAQRLAHAVMRLIEDAGESCDAGTLGELRRNRAVTAAVRAMWPKAEPVRLVLDLLTDPALMAGADRAGDVGVAVDGRHGKGGIDRGGESGGGHRCPTTVI